MSKTLLPVIDWQVIDPNAEWSPHKATDEHGNTWHKSANGERIILTTPQGCHFEGFTERECWQQFVDSAPKSWKDYELNDIVVFSQDVSWSHGGGNKGTVPAGVPMILCGCRQDGWFVCPFTPNETSGKFGEFVADYRDFQHVISRCSARCWSHPNQFRTQ